MKAQTTLNGLVGGSMLLALLGLNACSEKENLQQRIENPELMATWEVPCAKNDVFGIEYTQVLKRFSGEQYVEVHRFFEDDKCTKQSAELRYDGKFTVGTEVKPGVKAIDISVDKATMLATSEHGVNSIRVGWCGVAAFKLNTPVDLTGKGKGLCLIRQTPSAEYNVETVEGNKLFLGKTGFRGGATVPANRPADVERGTVFVKSNATVDLSAELDF